MEFSRHDALELAKCLLNNKPYFGPAMHAFQGKLSRHGYMTALAKKLVEEVGDEPIRAVEVGSWAGGSAVTWVSALKSTGNEVDLVCIDSWQPYFDLDIDVEDIYRDMNDAVSDGSIHQLFRHNVASSGVADSITEMIGTSCDILQRLDKEAFSLVFLDGSHSYEVVRTDIDLATGLLKTGGYLCGDDLELIQAQLDEDRLRADVASGKDYVWNEENNCSYHPGVTRAVAELVGEVGVFDGFWVVRKTENGWEPVLFLGDDITIPEHLQPLRSRMGALPHLVVEGYHGWNVVQKGAKYFAVRQAAGPVDFSLPLSEFERLYSNVDIVSGDDLNMVIGKLKTTLE